MQGTFACEKDVFWLSLLYHGNKGLVFLALFSLLMPKLSDGKPSIPKNSQSARFGDVSAQQNLASAYLTGAFNTPIQPANSLVWLEKSYLSITNQLVIDTSSGDASDLVFSESLAPIFSLLSTIPLANTVGSPAFPFGWKLFWKLADPFHSPPDSLSRPLTFSSCAECPMATHSIFIIARVCG